MFVLIKPKEGKPFIVAKRVWSDQCALAVNKRHSQYRNAEVVAESKDYDTLADKVRAENEAAKKDKNTQAAETPQAAPPIATPKK